MMAIAPPLRPTKCLTFEEYLQEGEIMARYDILEGERIAMPSPLPNHQDILLNLGELYRAYQRATKRGRTYIAPFDVLIRQTPRLQVRQPDVLFISTERWTQNNGAHPLAIAPELIVEILSESDTPAILASKLADYFSIGVLEAWLVWPETHRVEVLQLTSEGPVIMATYGETQTVQSLTFPDLQVLVADIFAP